MPKLRQNGKNNPKRLPKIELNRIKKELKK